MNNTNHKFEVLMVSMNKTIDSFDKNNLNAHFVIANQTNENSLVQTDNGIMVSTNTKGVGKNRNIALLYSSAKYLLFSDDDVCFVDNLEQKIVDAFDKVKNADVLIFNIETLGANTSRRVNTKIKRVRWFNFLNYGAVRIAIKKEKLDQKNIWFSTLFGGGTKYSCGEDTIFLSDCLKKKLKIYTYPLTICSVDQSTSTWFSGYNEKYFFDKGVLLKMVFPKIYRLFIYYYSHKFKTKEMSAKKIRRICMKGAKEIK